MDGRALLSVSGQSTVSIQFHHGQSMLKIDQTPVSNRQSLVSVSEGLKHAASGHLAILPLSGSQWISATPSWPAPTVVAKLVQLIKIPNQSATSHLIRSPQNKHLTLCHSSQKESPHHLAPFRRWLAPFLRRPPRPLKIQPSWR